MTLHSKHSHIQDLMLASPEASGSVLIGLIKLRTGGSGRGTDLSKVIRLVSGRAGLGCTWPISFAFDQVSSRPLVGGSVLCSYRGKIWFSDQLPVPLFALLSLPDLVGVVAVRLAVPLWSVLLKK